MIYKDIKIKMPKWVEYILNTLNEFGYESYIVGGCVRDNLLDRIPKDWDITTNALPEDIIDIFTSLGYKIVPTGLKHGTVTVIIDKEGYEITTYRIDGNYSDGRHSDRVEFTNDLKEDLSRRDFTINAMAYNSNGLVDYFEGIKDIKDGIIRFVGNSTTRIQEDSLRMLRACRFASQLGFEMDDEAIESICNNCNLIKNVSVERIQMELNKILIANNLDGLYHIIQNGIGNIIVPELIKTFKCNQNNPYHIYNTGQHILNATEIIEPNLPLRLTMLFHDIGKPLTKTTDDNRIDHFYGHAEKSAEMARDIMKRLKYDNATIEKVCLLIKYHDTRINSDKTIKKLLNKLGKENMYDFLKVREADIKAQNLEYYQERHKKILRIKNRVDEIIAKEECFSLKDLAINGKDLIDIGFKQGKEIGEILNWLLEKVIEDSQLNNKEELIKLVKERN